MNLREIRPDELEVVGSWLQDERNHRWLDFGAGRRSVDVLGLKMMCQRDLHWLRVYTPDDEDLAVGLVGLSNIDRTSATAEAWALLGRKEYGPRDLTIEAVSRMLEHGFQALELGSIFAWTVEVNRGGRRLLDRLGFRYVGRRRRCHRIGKRVYDRLLFDLLADEYHGYTALRSSGTPAVAAAEEER